MRILIITCFVLGQLCVNVLADSVQYGYNAQGNYVPTSIGGNRIQYGYNAQGNYVPTSIGR